jgi:hypothetical protein
MIALIEHGFDMSTQPEHMKYTLVEVLERKPKNITKWRYIAGDRYHGTWIPIEKVMLEDATEDDLQMCITLRNSLDRTIIENREHTREHLNNLRKR